jgi:hypothetical protein
VVGPAFSSYTLGLQPYVITSYPLCQIGGKYVNRGKPQFGEKSIARHNQENADEVKFDADKVLLRKALRGQKSNERM